MIYPLATTMAMEDPAFVHNFLACFLFESLIVPSFRCFAEKTDQDTEAICKRSSSVGPRKSVAKIRKISPSFTNSKPLKKKRAENSVCGCFRK